MKRDMDLIRQIVLAKQAADGPLTGLDGVAQEVFGEHVLLLKEAGLVDAAAQLVQHKVPRAIVFRLTWAGHDFAQSIAEDTLWRKAKEHVIKPSASWTFDVLLSFLRKEIERR